VLQRGSWTGLWRFPCGFISCSAADVLYRLEQLFGGLLTCFPSFWSVLEEDQYNPWILAGCVVKLCVWFAEFGFVTRVQSIVAISDSSACCHKNFVKWEEKLIPMVEWDILCIISVSVFLEIPSFLHNSTKLSCPYFRVDRMSRYRLSHKSLSSSSIQDQPPR